MPGFPYYAYFKTFNTDVALISSFKHFHAAPLVSFYFKEKTVNCAKTKLIYKLARSVVGKQLTQFIH